MASMNHTNLLKFYYSRFDEFRITQKFTDVTIECGNVQFNCHRVLLSAASEYFYIKFSADFGNSTMQNVRMGHTISAEVFSEVLQYIYSGNLIITSANMFALLEVSDILRLRGVEELCIDSLRRNKVRSVITILDLFAYACRTRKQKIMDVLSDNIAKNFRIVSTCDRFLEISFENLIVILKKTLALTLTLKSDLADAEMLFGVIVRWILYDREGRSRHFDDLFRNINLFGSISPEMIKLTMRRLMEMVPPACANALSSKLYSKVLGHGELRRAREPTENSLYVYIKLNGEDLVRIFLMDNANDWTLAGAIPDMTGANRWTRSAAVGSHHLYTLLYDRRRSKHIMKNENHLFYASTTADLQHRLSLKDPPIIFDDVSLCATRNNHIYAYDQTLSTRVLFPLNSSLTAAPFSSEEIGRGIYMYHCELDRWFPVPAMEKRRADACMTIHDDVLYVIGGRDLTNDPTQNLSFAQQYDCREGKWHSMEGALFSRTGADCCVEADQIYLIGGEGGAGKLIEAYEFAENRWSLRAAMCGSRSLQYHRIIPRYNELWGMGCFDAEKPSGGDLSISIFDTESFFKRASFTLADAAEKLLGKNRGFILDAVIFK